MAAWVHNALTDSFLEAYLAYGPRPLSASEADRFVAEQARVGELLGADPIPDTAEGLQRWIATHPEVAASAAQREAVGFLRSPP